MPTDSKTPITAEEELARRTRRSFLALGAGAVCAAGGVWWLRPDPESDDIPSPLRKVLGFNERVARAALYGNDHLAATYPASAVGKLKKNGDIGMEEELDPARWRLELAGRKLTLPDIQSLPRHEEIIDFKCVEGWSTVTQFAGARLSDFTAKFAPQSEGARYVGFDTPSGDYYVSIDMPSALHPQTLLAYEMNGAPLTSGHGAPLRLVMPVKYGIKNIKRIGKIQYTSERTRDYWTEQGYDWYAGL